MFDKIAYQKKWRRDHPEAFKNYYKGKEEKFKARSGEQIERNVTFITKIKDNKPCLDCKVMYPHYVLQFDHVRGEKIMDVSKMARGGYSLKSIQAEIDKCELVCSNCHSKRTHFRRAHNSMAE